VSRRIFTTVVIRFYLCYYCRGYGLIGGFGVLILYLLLLFRFVVASHKANTIFGKLVVMGFQ
jgi:cell division protein FtsW (lipid II flippase)